MKKCIRSIIPIDNFNDIKLSDRPDLTITNNEYCIGLEHFMTDYCFDGPSNNQSKSRIEERKLRDIYNDYHDDEKDIDDTNIPEAIDRLEESMIFMTKWDD